MRRQPQGIPAGGQYSTEPHDEPSGTLGEYPADAYRTIIEAEAKDN